MQNHVKFRTFMFLLIISASFEQRSTRAAAKISGKVLMKHQAVHKVLEALSRSQAEESIIEEKARVQRVVAQEAKKAYERDTGEEMVQMVNAKISSVRAEQALKKVIEAQELMKKLDQRVFEAKVKNNELARQLIQDENDLINAQIEYISANTESEMFNENSRNSGQELLDCMSLEYFPDTPLEKMVVRNVAKDSAGISFTPNNGSLNNFSTIQSENLALKILPYNLFNNSYSFARISNISEFLNNKLPTGKNYIFNSLQIPYGEAVLNTTKYVNSSSKYINLTNQIPFLYRKLFPVSQDEKNLPEVKFRNVIVPEAFNFPLFSKPDEAVETSTQVISLTAKLSQDQLRLIHDLKSVGDTAAYYQYNPFTNVLSEGNKPYNLFRNLFQTENKFNYSPKRVYLQTQQKGEKNISDNTSQRHFFNYSDVKYTHNSSLHEWQKKNKTRNNLGSNSVCKYNFSNKSHENILNKSNLLPTHLGKIFPNGIFIRAPNLMKNENNYRLSKTVHSHENVYTQSNFIKNTTIKHTPANRSTSILKNSSKLNPKSKCITSGQRNFLKINNPTFQNKGPPTNQSRSCWKDRSNSSNINDRLHYHHAVNYGSKLSNIYITSSKPIQKINSLRRMTTKSLPKLSAKNFNPILRLGKANGFLQSRDNEIGIRDVLSDLQNRKYIKLWNT